MWYSVHSLTTPLTHAARVQIKVNTKGDAAAEERWGAGKQKVDAMDYKLWLLDHLLDERRAAQKTAQQEVRLGSLSACLLWLCHAQPCPCRGAMLC